MKKVIKGLIVFPLTILFIFIMGSIFEFFFPVMDGFTDGFIDLMRRIKDWYDSLPPFVI